MSLLLPALLLLSSLPALAADSLDCDLARGEKSLPLSSRVVDGEAVTGTGTANELQLGLDASLSRGSFLLVLQDDLRQRRVAFTAGPRAASGASLSSGEIRTRCAIREDEPSKAMPNRPEIAEYFVCVLDEARFENGVQISTKRLLKRSMHTALFRQLPHQVKASDGKVRFDVRFHRADFSRGFSVSLEDLTTGADARFEGPSSALAVSFMLGVTQGSREANGVFHRLGCAFAASPNALD